MSYIGFIAQEVEKAAQQADLSFSGVVAPQHDQDHYTLRYAEFVVPLMKAEQKQQVQIKEENQQFSVGLPFIAYPLKDKEQETSNSPNTTIQQLNPATLTK